MDQSRPCLRLNIIITPSADITCLWNTFRPVNHAFLRLIIGDLPLLADFPIDWTLLRTAISFWDTQRAVFNFQGTELALTVEEYAALFQRSMPTHDIVVPNQFATIQSRLAILLGLRNEEIRRELQYGGEHGIRTTWLIDFIQARALDATGDSYQRDACHRCCRHRRQTFQTQRAQSKEPCRQSCKSSEQSINNWRRIDILLVDVEEWPKSNNLLSRSKTRHQCRHTPFRKTRM
ncbi:hypothetical protein CRG98_008757 [Punica granatum]|uniref:DUF7745 domain-containing protein n=1 Tax=Punica granatum TaxID=22663 RepID=A0A2I0KSP2_PUNGR|nr:hypothetical protein CRG98_008757 [Punica granatum]